MAFVRIEYCHKCGKETQHVNRRCSECVYAEEEACRKAWDSMTTEWKLSNLRDRIEKLEQSPARY